ncbi:MAG: rhomboid family intramembrane serine protease [Candidatus Brocadiaceae bacterium]|jgi:membrane associated rhomboid family serine protease
MADGGRRHGAKFTFITGAPRRRKFFTPAVTVLALLNLAGFLVPLLLPARATAGLVRTFALTPGKAFLHLHLWQLTTHTMLYPSPCAAWSLVCTLVFLVMLGSRLEAEWGTARFLIFWLVIGALSGVVRMLPHLGSGVPLIGSLGVVGGLLAAVAVVFRHEDVHLIFGRVRMPHFIIGLLVILLLLNCAPLANVLWFSGAAFGFVYARCVTGLGGRRVEQVAAPGNRFSDIDVGD